MKHDIALSARLFVLALLPLATACHRLHMKSHLAADAKNGGGGAGSAQAADAPPPALAAAGSASALTQLTSDDSDEIRPVLSPDGKTILFESDTAGKDASGAAVTTSSIVGIPADGGTQRTLYTASNTQGASPSWMPDGKGFVYVSDSMGSWALVRSLAGSPNSAVSVVASGNVAQNPACPAVSPDGKRIAFATKVRDAWTLATIHTDGTQLMTFGPGWDPKWSPDGKRLAFVRDVNGTHQIFTVDASTGADLTQLPGPPGSSNNGPAYSPDGAWLVFVSSAAADGSQPTNLFAVKPDGTGLTQLTTTQGDCVYPFWAKSGQLYFSADPGKTGHHDLYRMQLPDELAGNATGDATVVQAPAKAKSN